MTMELMLQGLEAINVEPIKFANMVLFYCAILMASGLIWITIGVFRTLDYEVINEQTAK